MQFGQISVLLLPGKRTFHNLDKKFLEKRRIALDTYLQVSFGEISHSVECAYYLRNQPKVITLYSFLWCWWYFHSWGRFQCNKRPPPVSLSFVFCITSWRWPISVMSCSNLRATLFWHTITFDFFTLPSKRHYVTSFQNILCLLFSTLFPCSHHWINLYIHRCIGLKSHHLVKFCQGSTYSLLTECWTFTGEGGYRS